MSLDQPTSDVPAAQPDEPDQPDQPAAPAPSRPFITEDWLATILGLSIVVLVLAGVITKGMVP